jgi:hypothetical protein
MLVIILAWDQEAICEKFKTKNPILKKVLFYVIIFVGLVACNSPLRQIESDYFILGLDSKGYVSSLIDKKSGINYSPNDQKIPLLTVRISGRDHQPIGMTFENGVLTLDFGAECCIAKIAVEEKDTHLTFELLDIKSDKHIDLVIWGPYPTTINKIIGETVGVVRGEEFAIGLQALNPKTLGGYPWNENDCMPQLDIFESGDYSDLSEEGKRYVLYRVEAAKPEDFGSTLQAYCRNRNEDRLVDNWQHPGYVVPAFDDGGVAGSKIALFGCPVDEALDFIGAIEVKEGLPHPLIDGHWGKLAQSASASYLILGFGVNDINRAIGYTKQAGLKYLDHPGPFKTWGHFQLNDQFPSGWESLKKCVDEAESKGVHLGVHTLSNFITTNDPFVSPLPDPRLAKIGYSSITADINSQQADIPVASDFYFSQLKNNNLKTVQIDDELIQYGRVGKTGPFTLTDCQRGAFGTFANAHTAGSEISLLADHGYKVFLSNADLTVEIAKNIANLYNETGLRQISFDGLEGNRSTGMGNYGEILMTNTWYENLDEKIRQHYIADASRTSHYFWHIYSRMNWGEPWYAGFRESQTDYRFKNQKYFQRNMMPGMLGWFLMTETTSLEDIEWMLSKAAGYNAGFGLVSKYVTFEKNGLTDEILEQINLWEHARMQQLFSSAQMELLRDVKNEFRLNLDDNGDLKFYNIKSFKLSLLDKEKQPGEPTSSSFEIENPYKAQPLQFIICAINADAADILFTMDNYKTIQIPGKLKKGEILKYNGAGKILKYSENWQKLEEMNIDQKSLQVIPGSHLVAVDCGFSGEDDGELKVELRFISEGELLKKNFQ